MLLRNLAVENNSAASAGGGGSGGGGGAAGLQHELATAEATVRQLRGQLEQMAEINKELYEMAANATLGAAPMGGLGAAQN